MKLSFFGASLCVVFLTGMALVFSFSHTARADAIATHKEPWMDGILHEYMPFLFKKEEGPKPEETLVAPFADPEILEKSRNTSPDEATLPINAVPLHLPHRTAKEVGRWLMVATAESLSFESGAFSDRQKKIAAYFTPEAYQKYSEFLNSGAYRKTLREGGMSLHNFVREEPFLLNNGAVGAQYRWLFEVPVMLSYLPADSTGYKDKDPVNEELIFKIEVSRVPNAGTEEILISNWSATAAR